MAIERLDIPRELVRQPYFAIRSYENFKSWETAETLLLNSFFSAIWRPPLSSFARVKCR